MCLDTVIDGPYLYGKQEIMSSPNTSSDKAADMLARPLRSRHTLGAVGGKPLNPLIDSFELHNTSG